MAGEPLHQGPFRPGTLLAIQQRRVSQWQHLRASPPSRFCGVMVMFTNIRLVALTALVAAAVVAGAITLADGLQKSRHSISIAVSRD